MAQQNILGSYLRGKREASELSQSDVAGQLGYSTAQYISNFERGVCQPSLKIIARLSKIYKVNLQELFEVVMDQQRVEVSKVLFKTKVPKAKKAKSARRR